MRIKDILAVLGVAAATVAFVVMLFGPASVGAVDEVEPLKAAVFPPTLTIEGCQLALKTDKSAYQPGDTPSVIIEAANPTDQPVEVTVALSIMSSSPVSPVSRSLSIPQPMWQGECKVVLGPGETKTFTQATDVKLEAGQNVTISAGDKRQALATVLNMLSNGQAAVQQNGSTIQAVPDAVPLIQLIQEQPEQ